MESSLFKSRDTHTVPSIQPRFFCCIHPCGISVRKMDSWAKWKGMRTRKSGFGSKLPEAPPVLPIACAPALHQAAGKGAHHTQPHFHPLVQARKKHPDQEILSVVQNETGVSAPWMFNDTLVIEQDLPFSKAHNL